MSGRNQISGIIIRKADIGDVDVILGIYDAARAYMRSTGNMTQWVNGYPSRDHILADIARGVCYIGIDADGEAVMAFAFIIGDDPTYDVIEDGRWLNDKPYGTIHRLGSTGKYSGIFARCIDFCSRQIPNLRLDTHADNATMLNAAGRLGFTRCGIIYCQDGTPRIAFQRSL